MHHKETSLFLRTFSNSKFWSGDTSPFALFLLPPSSPGHVGLVRWVQPSSFRPTLQNLLFFPLFSTLFLQAGTLTTPFPCCAAAAAAAYPAKRRGRVSRLATVAKRELSPPRSPPGAFLPCCRGCAWRGGEEGRGYGVGGGGATLLPLLV